MRVEPELEEQPDRLARSQAKSRSACVREAIALDVRQFGDGDKARRQSALIAQQSRNAHWSEQLPDWSD